MKHTFAGPWEWYDIEGEQRRVRGGTYFLEARTLLQYRHAREGYWPMFCQYTARTPHRRESPRRLPWLYSGPSSLTYRYAQHKALSLPAVLIVFDAMHARAYSAAKGYARSTLTVPCGGQREA